MSEELQKLVEKYTKWRESVADCAGYEGSNAGDIANASDYLTYGTIIEDLKALAKQEAVAPRLTRVQVHLAFIRQGYTFGHGLDEVTADLNAMLASVPQPPPAPMWICPNCKREMPYPPRSYNICPNCMIEFGNDDARDRQLIERGVRAGIEAANVAVKNVILAAGQHFPPLDVAAIIEKVVEGK